MSDFYFFFQGLWVRSNQLLKDSMFKSLFLLADRVESKLVFFFFPDFQLFLLSVLPLNMTTLWPELLCSADCFLLLGAGFVWLQLRHSYWYSGQLYPFISIQKKEISQKFFYWHARAKKWLRGDYLWDCEWENGAVAQEPPFQVFSRKAPVKAHSFTLSLWC